MDDAAARMKRLVGPAFLSLTIGLSACTGSSGGTDWTPSPTASAPQGGIGGSVKDDAVAVVGGKTISRSELTDRLMVGYGAEVLRELMLHEAVGREAASLGVTVSDAELDRELKRMSEGYGSEQEFYASMLRQLGMDRGAVREDAKFRLLLEKLATRDVTIPETDIRHYYDEHQQDYGARNQYELSWILTETKEEAQRVLGLLEGGDDFVELAGRYSVDEMTAASGGNLGWLDERDPFQDAKVLAAAGRLQVGESFGPVETDHGYAVIQLNGKKTIQGKSYDTVRDEIRRQLSLEQAKPMHDLEQALLVKYGAQVLDPKLKMPEGT